MTPFCLEVSFAPSCQSKNASVYLEAEVENVGAEAAIDGAGGRVVNDELGRSLHSWHDGHDGTEGKSERQDCGLHLVGYVSCRCIVRCCLAFESFQVIKKLDAKWQ